MQTPAQTLPASVVDRPVEDVAPTAPVPAPEVAAIQLRAINHRLLRGAPDPGGHRLEALTAEDFLFTADDGTWHDRAGFLAEVKRRPPFAGASCEDQCVRLFGYRLDNHRVAVPKAIDRQASDKVQVFLTGIIPDTRSLTSGYSHGMAHDSLHVVFIVQFRPVSHNCSPKARIAVLLF